MLCCSTELQAKLPGDMDGLGETFERLQHSLQQAQDYVDAVVVRRAALRSIDGSNFLSAVPSQRHRHPPLTPSVTAACPLGCRRAR